MGYQEDFIGRVAPLVQEYAIEYGYKIASPIIGQGCLETGYGKTNKAIYHNNLFGLKYRKDRVNTNNGYFADGGSEQNPNGTWVALPNDTLWYHFDTYEKSIEGYFQFINIDRYANLKTASSPLQYLTNIREDGYATDLNYVQKISNIIAKYNLTQYDTLKIDPIEKPSRTSLDIIKCCGTANTTVSQNRKIEWIVIHYTAGTNSKTGTARSIASYFSKTSTKASADFIVDNGEIVQYNPDLTNRYTWAVGGSKYASMTTSQGGKFYGICKNANSISIELCSSKTNTKTLNATDTDWYFNEAVINNGADLVNYLMNKYHIDINHVIMHHQVTGKICPNPWCVNEKRLEEWNNFIKLVNRGGAIPSVPEIKIEQPSNAADVNYQVQVLINDLVIRNKPNGSEIGKRTGKGTFTIIKQWGQWGYLKSGAGWIYLANEKWVKKVNRPTTNFRIKVHTALNVYKAPDGDKNGKICPPGTYTIVDKNNDWGKLLSGLGWINLSSDHVTKI